MATDAVVRQVLRNLAYAGHRARTIRVQHEAGSVWFSALIFRYPTESRYFPRSVPPHGRDLDAGLPRISMGSRLCSGQISGS
jgi:hypothetical protein